MKLRLLLLSTLAPMDALVGVSAAQAACPVNGPADEGPRLTTGWLRLNLSHEFMDQPSASFSSENGPVVFQADLGSYWAEANSGLTHQMSRSSALIANVGY